MQILKRYIYMDMEMKFIFYFDQALFPTKFQTFELFHAPILPFFLLGFYRIRSSSFYLDASRSARWQGRKLPPALTENFHRCQVSFRWISARNTLRHASLARLANKFDLTMTYFRADRVRANSWRSSPAKCQLISTRVLRTNFER